MNNYLKERLEKETNKELEFQTILEEISKYCNSTTAKEKAINLRIFEDTNKLRDEHNNLNEIVRLRSANKDLPLAGISELKDILNKAKITNSILETEELLEVKSNLRAYRLIDGFYNDNLEELSSSSTLLGEIYYDKILEKHISDCIDDNAEVKDDASKELFSLRKKIISASQRLRNKLENIMRKNFEDDVLQEDFYSIREGRFVLPVKAEYKRQIPGIIHGVSDTGRTVFLEPSEIIELNNDLSLLRNEEKKEVYKILQTLTAEVGSKSQDIDSSNKIISKLDFLNAKAKYALKYDCQKPEIIDEKEIELRDIFHPILLKNKDRKEVIPLSVKFAENIDGFLITGPNAGGKTVALKSIGLNLLMATSGIFPTGFCKTGIRNIFTSIGDHQSIENDLSTFSSQIKRVKDILDVAEEDSLVLVDEICSGTDPREGAALASGILDSFINYKYRFVVTTHQSSLKTYALNKEGIENGSLEFDEIGLKPSYVFLPGVPGNSYAFNLAQNIGINEKILERSKQYLDVKENEIEKGISEIVQYRKNAEKVKREAESKLRQANQLRDDLETKLNDLKDKKEEYKKKAKIEAESVLAQANKLVENTIREIKEGQRKAGEIKKEFESKKSQLKEKLKVKEKKRPQKSTETINNGDSVTIEDFDTVGKVIEIDESNKNAIVEFSGLKFKTDIKKLSKVDEKPVKQENRRKSASDYVKFDTSSRIDLRGKRVNEAMREFDAFINDAIVSGVPFLTIVHGKGTGALREAIHEYLNNAQSVKDFRSGTLAEGGEGVTIIEL